MNKVTGVRCGIIMRAIKMSTSPPIITATLVPLCVAGDVITQPNSFMLVVMVQIHPAVF